MLRLFIAIALPPELRLRLSLLEQGIPGARWVDPRNLHLTLRFLGEVDEGIASDIDGALARIHTPRFSVTLAGTGTFGSPAPHTLWAGIDKNPALFHLREKIDSALARLALPPGILPADSRRYSPHVTLARLNRVSVTRLQGFLQTHALFRSELFPVDHFSLVASYLSKSGAIYEDQAGYRLD